MTAQHLPAERLDDRYTAVRAAAAVMDHRDAAAADDLRTRAAAALAGLLEEHVTRQGAAPMTIARSTPQ